MRDRSVLLAERLVQQARDQVMPFWLAHGIDRECGGYWTDLRRNGERYGAGEKWIVVQTRTIYSMCLAYAWFNDPRYLEQAAQGTAFFRAHFRDREHGGWYYCVDRDGSTVLDDAKQPYALAFASYALAEYARLSGDRAALQDAIDTHELVMERCWDGERRGLPNQFTADWRLVEGIKRVDTHMHTMEAVSALYHATHDPNYLTRLTLLADTILGTIGVDGCYDPEHGCTHEMFHMDWQEAVERSKGLCNFGHVTEAGWFISKLAAYTGDERHARMGRGLVAWAMRHGFDRARGGLFNYGEPTGRVVNRVKVWWNQAELLGALAFLYRLTGELSYLDTLETHLHFIETYQLDRTYGEWYPEVEADGSLGIDRPDNKGSRWKSPYHVMQGLYHAHHDLRRAAGIEPVEEPKAWDDFCL